ncbi:MAG: sulfatase [Rhodothermales bacterium]
MRQRCVLLFLFGLVGGVQAQTSADIGAASNGARPNVLFIAVDDLRPQLGAYGARHIHSPNIDRLAESGVLFRRAYVQQAVCSPSRTSLMTGLRPDASRVYDLATHFRETVPDVVTLPQHFGRHGYRTAWWGKIYHAGLLDSLSWTEGGERFSDSDRRGYIREAHLQIAAANNGRGPAYERTDVPDKAYPDGKVADQAITSLRRFAEGEEPFFLAVGFYKPHLPFNAPERYWALYDTSTITPPDVQVPPEGAPDLALTNWGELRNYHGIPEEGPLSDSLARTLIHGYYASVSYTDAQVGRVLDELDRLGLAENTIVVLWGDHGWKLGEYGDWCKHTNFELDTRAPLVVRAPNMEAGQKTDALVEFVDIYPTLTELAGLPLPAHLQGTSFAPLLDDPGRPWKGAAFSQYPRRFPSMRSPEPEDWESLVMGYSVRTDRWRYTRWQRGPQDAPTDVVARELYDLSEGPAPTINLAGRPEYVALVDSLDAVLSAGWRAARARAGGPE